MASLTQFPRPAEPPSPPLPRRQHLPPPPPPPAIFPPSHDPNLFSTQRWQLSLERNHQSFDETPRDVVAWTSSIATCCRKGLIPEAVASFAGMLSSSVQPNHVTFITLFSACADFPSQSLRLGCSIHGQVFKWCPNGGLDDVVTGTSLVDMYSKCGRVDLARQVFDQMGVKNSVSWNTMIDGYMRGNDVDAAVSLFRRMPKKDKVSWTAVINGYINNGRLEESLQCFREMQRHRIDPDYVTVIAVLSACANLGALGQGLWLHRYAMKQDYGANVRLNNSLIDMYSRCGSIGFGRQVFEKMCKRTRVSWNSMIVGLAVNGFADDSLKYFSMMRKEGFEPDGVSFTGALTACTHAGLVDEGLRFYNVMTKVYGISPRIEHYGCVVDLLSRAGRLKDAMVVIEGMPMKPNEIILGSLMAACRVHENISLAERLMGYLSELEPNSDSNYILLSNMYAGTGRWDNVGKVRNAMKSLGIRKKPGYSAVEVDGNIHEFIAGDKSHPHSSDIHAMLQLLCFDMKLAGYATNAIDLSSNSD